MADHFVRLNLLVVIFLYFIKLLIESIHPFSKGVDCVSK